MIDDEDSYIWFLHEKGASGFETLLDLVKTFEDHYRGIGGHRAAEQIHQAYEILDEVYGRNFPPKNISARYFI